MLRIRLLGATQRAEAESAWKALEAEIRSPSLSCSWAWTGTWLAHYGEAVTHRFALAERDGAPCGLALITQPTDLGRLRPPTLALGTAGEPAGASVFVERNRMLARADDLAPFAVALMEQLERDEPRWQRLRLDGMLPDEAKLLLGGRVAARWQVQESPVADLLAGQDGDVLAALPSSRRQRVRRAIRNLGELQTQWAEDVGEAQEMLDELIALHTARWQSEGQAGAFSDPRFTAFHRALIAQMLPAGRAALFRVRREGETIACLYGLVEGDRMMFYQGGMKRFDDNRLRVGVAAHALFMQGCRERGFSKYDFLAPAARYKSDLSTHCDQLVWAELERPGARLKLERVARAAKRRLARPAG